MRPLSPVKKSNRGKVPSDRYLVQLACVALWTYTKDDVEFAVSNYIKRHTSEFVSVEKLEGFVRFAQGIGPKKQSLVAWGHDIPELEKFSDVTMWYRLTSQEITNIKTTALESKVLEAQLSKFMNMNLRSSK